MKANPCFKTLEADSLVLALDQDVDLSLLEGVPGPVVQNGVAPVGASTLMTGPPGLFAGGDMVPAGRQVTVAMGPARKPRATSMPGCVARQWPRRPNMKWPASSG